MIIIANKQKDFFDAMLVRTNVFVVEQQIDPNIEIDTLDYDAVHFIYYHNNKPVGTARLVVNDDTGKVGRVAVLNDYRHLKIGSKLMNYIEGYSRDNNIKYLKLGAQLYVTEFYKKLGYKSYGDIFLDAEIEHIMMKKVVL